jgi:hypothetical protein
MTSVFTVVVKIVLSVSERYMSGVNSEQPKILCAYVASLDWLSSTHILFCLFHLLFLFFYKSEFISKNANLKGAPSNYTKSITKSA